MTRTSDQPLLFTSSRSGPRYLQLARMISGRIDAGDLKPGERLPSEHELVRDYGVSRTTAIAALDELVRSHAAYRVQGKGSFVGKAVINRFSLASSFSADMRRRGLEPGSRVIALDDRPIDAETARHLSASREDQWHRLVRLRLADGEPMAYQSAFIPRGLFPDLLRHDFEENSLYEVMRRHYGIGPRWAEAVVEARLPADEEAKALEISPRAPIMLVWHLTLDETFRPLEYVRSAYRADRFNFASGRQPLDEP